MKSETFVDFEDTNLLWTWMNYNDGIHFRQYQLDKLVASDTDSCMMRLDDIFDKSAHVDDVTEYADNLAQETNSKYPDFMMSAFNVPKERSTLISTDREAIADKSIFLAKKFYIMHILNYEGVACDKFKIMGVELKKSNFGDFLKYAVWECVQHIFEDGDENGLIDIIKRLEGEFMEAPLSEIGTPISCKTLKKNVDLYENTGSFNGVYWAYKGVILYNERRKNSEPKINPGDKAYSFYIKDDVVNTIAFPLDSPIPEWANDMWIDREKMWAGVYRSIHNYMKAIGWDFKSKKEEVRTSLFGAF